MKIDAPGSWRDPETHFVQTLSHPWYKGLALLQDVLSSATSDFFRSRRLRTVHLPITTPSVSSPIGLGSDSLPVRIEISGQPTYLADSMQFMLEYGCRLFPEGCWYIMPSFRGEERDDRHLTQFFHAEAEISGGLDQVISFVEDYVRALARAVLADAECRAFVLSTAGNDAHLLGFAHNAGPFKRLTFDEAANILDSANPGYVDVLPNGARSIGSRAERRLMEILGEPLWVTHFDHLTVPFYQATDPADRRKAKNADLLFGIGEVVGAGERHSTDSELASALHTHSVSPSDYAWYVEMKKLRPMHTSGFGLGLERFALWVLQHHDIRDCQIAPRDNVVVYQP